MALAAFFLGCFVAAVNAQSAPFRLANPKEIHDMLVERIDVEHKSDAIVVGVITKKAREIIAYGEFDRGDPHVPDGQTVFEIGSISKVFTSLLLADMVVKGEVKLSDPISKYLPPSVHVPTRDGKQIALLDLSTHYSGLPQIPTNFSWNYSVNQLYDFLDHYTLTRDPGRKFEYSNLGGGLLGQVLALRAGTDYETLLHTRITGPLHMNHTAVHLTPEMKANLAPGHQPDLRTSLSIEDNALSPAGAVRSTVEDMLIFLAANLGFIKSPLQSAMKQMLSIRRSQGPGLDIGLGWNIQKSGSEVAFHNGRTYGYYAFAGFDPHRKVGVVVLSNSDNPIADIAWRIFNYPVKGPVEEIIGPPNLPH